MAAKSKSKSALDIVEQAARALGMCACREYRVATPRIDAVVDLLVTHESRRIAYGEGKNGDLVRWIIVKGAASGAGEVQILFENDRLARSAQRLADKLKASWKAAHLSVLCLTADAAVQRLRDATGAGVEVGAVFALVPEHLPQKRNRRAAASAARRDSPCQSAVLLQ